MDKIWYFLIKKSLKTKLRKIKIWETGKRPGEFFLLSLQCDISYFIWFQGLGNFFVFYTKNKTKIFKQNLLSYIYVYKSHWIDVPLLWLNNTKKYLKCFLKKWCFLERIVKTCSYYWQTANMKLYAFPFHHLLTCNI